MTPENVQSQLWISLEKWMVRPIYSVNHF